MNLSSRWCVSAVVALGALGCSDPVPPPAQGAFVAHVNSVSPAPQGKSCPSGTSSTFEVPAIPTDKPQEALSGSTYVHRVIDGENAAGVSCTVKGNGAAFEGRLSYQGKSLELTSGTLDATLHGTARISLVNGSANTGFSGALTSPSANCVIDASTNGGINFQAAPGHMWASFSCPSVEQQPSTYCGATGTFVLENCSQ